MRALHTRPKPPAPSFSTMAKSLWKRECPRSPALVRVRVRVAVGVWVRVRISVRGSSQGKGSRAEVRGPGSKPPCRLGSQSGPPTDGPLESLLHLLLHVEPLEAVLQPERGVRVLLPSVLIVHAVARARLCAAAAATAASGLPPDDLLQSGHPFAERRA